MNVNADDATPPETEAPVANLTWRDHQFPAERLDDVLKVVTTQTGLRFEKEMREMEVWFAVENRR